MSKSEIVKCPFCNEDVTVEYEGGMDFGAGGLVGAMPVSEGRCSGCNALVMAQAILEKTDEGMVFNALVTAYAERCDYGTSGVIFTKPGGEKSYIKGKQHE